MQTVTINTSSTQRLCYSIDKTAEALDVNRSTIFRLIKLGKLSKVHILGRTVVEHAEIERFLNENRVQVAQ